jgi:hypothetical protein
MELKTTANQQMRPRGTPILSLVNKNAISGEIVLAA